MGAERVTTVELHPDPAATARERLAAAGLRPTVVTGDGAVGVPHGAPSDRIIATCGAPRVPGAWVSQLADGGRIVVDLRSESSSGLIVLDRSDPEHVSGRFTGRPGHFMWMRPDPDHPLRDPAAGPHVRAHDERTTVRDVADHPDELDRPVLRTLVGIDLPEVEMLMTGVRSLYSGDGSWAQLTDDASTVAQGGPRRLWGRVETLAGIWRQLGSPDTDRYGVTVSSGGRHVFWLDAPSTALPEGIGPRPIPQGDLLSG
ncbi:hypothetical protein [Pseudonocardia sp. NPDC046786]|uniref:hypothetical protein n=1 Tax=Pseudonocardia sp. NPDC046786 TaxID=3155471 RepID=UPI0033F40D7C